ncbi:MAG: hypothetical protein AUI02_07115 [Acidobacteria bacterium 13_2_20CM_2_57_12]|nr:MAG: hypothetical protein AUI02_07115 [Acidobacteria bacterium 13_2_20CM_2_57_12]
MTVAPATVSLNKGGSRTFTATVNGTMDQSVFWEIVEATPKSGDSTHGFISNGGVYVAPTTVPSPANVTIKAVSGADTTKSGTAAVTIQAGPATSVSITGGSRSVPTFGSTQFIATVTGNLNTAVTWQVNGVNNGGLQTGAISATGLFKAPNSVPVLASGNNSGQTSQVVVTAISQAVPTAMDSVLVTIMPPQQNAQGANSPLGVSGGNAGDPIVQPGLIDNNCATPPTVATLSQFFNMETGPAPKIDAALALINTGAVDTAGTILQLGGTASNPPANGPPHAGSGVAPTVGRAVAKSGRSTGLTCSSIFATQANINVEYQKGCGTGSTFNVSFTNQVDITNNGFSAEGDSGSLIVTQDTSDPVALLFAGSGSDTVGNPISDVLNGLADPANPQSKPVIVGDSSPTGHTVAACSLPGPQSATAARLAVQRAAVSAEPMQSALTVRDARLAELMAHPEVQAVGVGASYDNSNEPAILLFVTKGQPRSNLPAQIDGIRTRIVEGTLFSQRGAVTAAESTALEEGAVPPQLVYPISDAEVARAKIVHAAHSDEWMKKAGVQGVGIGASADAPGEAALVIFLIHGVAHDSIPPVIDGLRTRVRESSRFRAGFGDAPAQNGCSMPAARKTPPRVSNSRPKP